MSSSTITLLSILIPLLAIARLASLFEDKILLCDKKFRRLGIGRKLMLKARDYAISKKISMVELSTSTNNKNAQTLYESLDYERDREYYNYYLEI